MVDTLLTAALICAGSLLVGQGACRLAGYERFTWVSPAVGFSVLMLVATAALRVPGRATTTAAICFVLALAGATLLIRAPSLRPRLSGVLMGVPAFVASLLPFAANGRSGVFGWSFYNDMSIHLLWADAYRSKAIAAINALPSSYPLGPHALAGTVAQGLGIGVDKGFTAMQIAVVVITAWTALGALGRVTWWGRVAVVTVAANVYLLASYYGEGAFKETIEAMLVLAFALGLRELVIARRWAPLSLLPLALILAASLATYSYTGLIWPGATLAVLGAGLAAIAIVRLPTTRSLASAHVADAGRLLVPLAVGALVLVVVLIPEIPRLAHFFEETTSNGTINAIGQNNLGPLPKKLSGWEVFGIWTNPDFRFLPANQLRQGLWTAVSAVAVAYGLVWWIRRRDFVLPAAVIASFAVYALAARNQSPYVLAKALVILSPMLIVLAGRGLLDGETPPRPSRDVRLLGVGLAALLLFGAARSSYQAMRFSLVGSDAHARELASFRPLLAGKRVLYLGADDFIYWELPDVRVSSPWAGTGPAHSPSSRAVVTLRPNKPWQYGQGYDFDSIEPPSYDQFAYVIAPRDGRLSSPPTNLMLVRHTRDFNLFRRVARTPDRRILNEGEGPGAVLNCNSRDGRRISELPGVAAIREAPIALALPVLAPGGEYSSAIHLPTGRWVLTMPYMSAQPMTLSLPELRVRLPANLDRPGAGWPAGEALVRKPGAVPFRLTVDSTFIHGFNQPVYANALVATRARPDTFIPLRRACGKYVDWYLPAR
ncbi:MAG: hypothetical protein E6G34_05475 [Actinobacteria bacterium]|nr:MAG: hypothetical protein E6G34_05475 [Actinomycetota bacterium]